MLLYTDKIENGKLGFVTPNSKIAQSQGWKIVVEDEEVVKGSDGNTYLKGYLPNEVLAEEKRADRDRLLNVSDKRMLPDFPISAEEKEQWLLYREYLRNITDDPKFPHVDVLSFENWLGQIHSKEPVLGAE